MARPSWLNWAVSNRSCWQYILFWIFILNKVVVFFFFNLSLARQLTFESHLKSALLTSAFFKMDFFFFDLSHLKMYFYCSELLDYEQKKECKMKLQLFWRYSIFGISYWLFRNLAIDQHSWIKDSPKLTKHSSHNITIAIDA